SRVAASARIGCPESFAQSDGICFTRQGKRRLEAIRDSRLTQDQHLERTGGRPENKCGGAGANSRSAQESAVRHESELQNGLWSPGPPPDQSKNHRSMAASGDDKRSARGAVGRGCGEFERIGFARSEEHTSELH